MKILHNEYLIDWQMDKINDICMGGWINGWNGRMMDEWASL